MTTAVQELPEVGEIVVATINKIMDQGAYVTLDEYNNIQGFLHISEIATGWIRHVEKFLKVGEKKVLLVKRVNTARTEIDLSLKQISSDQKKKKLLEIIRKERKRSTITAQKFKKTKKKIRPIITKTQATIENKGDTFKYTKEESKKTREG